MWLAPLSLSLSWISPTRSSVRMGWNGSLLIVLPPRVPRVGIGRLVPDLERLEESGSLRLPPLGRTAGAQTGPPRSLSRGRRMSVRAIHCPVPTDRQYRPCYHVTA